MNKSKKNKKEKRVKNYKKNQSIKKINNSVRGDDANQSRIHSRLGIDIKGPAKKLWGGRFKESTEKLVDEFSSSLSLDKRMWKEDLLGSIAHAEMLVHQKIISKNEGKKIINALNEISLEIEKKVQKGEDPFF